MINYNIFTYIDIFYTIGAAPVEIDDLLMLCKLERGTRVRVFHLRHPLPQIIDVI